jgi:NADH-quinone oxidoreductase subunit F
MLVSGIPSYRLKRDVLKKEIDSLLDEHVKLRCEKALGRDFTLESLFADGYKAVFLALGAHKSRRLNIEGEDIAGVQPAIQFLKSFNLRGAVNVRGKVGIIGGGNSAVDAARVALRQPGVESVTIFYRRTRQDMPALKEEIASAVAEGIGLECLVAPTRVLARDGHLTGIECVRNTLGRMDASGRRQPQPVPGTDFAVPLDHLIVTIGDEPDIDYVRSMKLQVTDRGTLWVDPETMQTSRSGVFAGGDVVTGPNTVVMAIAAGKKVAAVIDRYIRGEELATRAAAPRLPQVYVEPLASADGAEKADRVAPPTLPPDVRKRSFAEVELAITVDDARREAARCLRCDLEFTRPVEHVAVRATGEPT